MRKKYIIITLLIGFFISFLNFTTFSTETYKCMIQMTNYNGEGAYVAVSVLDSKNNYVETLKLFGDDDEWYKGLEAWYPYYKKNKRIVNVDAISGETLSGGERATFQLKIPQKYLDKNYQLRFETAVEEQSYKKNDVLIVPLNAKNLNGKYNGSGYIRYVRLAKS